jgi:hypothetical protein
MAEGCLLVYDAPAHKTYKGILKFLEVRGYLLSTEISTDSIGIVPNTTTGFYIEPFGYYCWCHIDVDINCEGLYCD